MFDLTLSSKFDFHVDSIIFEPFHLAFASIGSDVKSSTLLLKLLFLSLIYYSKYAWMNMCIKWSDT